MPIITFDRFEEGIDRRKSVNIADANRLHRLINGYVTSGWAIRRRPGTIRLDSPLPFDPVTKGLFGYDGKLYTFDLNEAEINPPGLGDFPEVRVIGFPIGPTQVVLDIHYVTIFNGSMYVVVNLSGGGIRHYFGPPNVTGGFDLVFLTQAPRVEHALKLNSKIYAIVGDVVQYSATGNPADWNTADDAGFLPTGIRASGSPNARALGEYDGQLVVFMDDEIQIWNVDTDPANNGLVRVIRNVSTKYARTISPVSRDLFFLSDAGFRSIARQSATENIDDQDIGSPIDSLVNVQAGENPVSKYYPLLGQYLCAIGNTIYAFTYSSASKVSAWSIYNMPFVVDDMESVGADMYIHANSLFYKFSTDIKTDADVNGNPVTFEVNFQTAYQHFKKPSVLKQIVAFDFVGSGDAVVSHKYLANEGTVGTTPITLQAKPITGINDTRHDGKIPVEVCTTAIATEIIGTDLQQIDAFSYEFTEMANR